MSSRISQGKLKKFALAELAACDLSEPIVMQVGVDDVAAVVMVGGAPPRSRGGQYLGIKLEVRGLSCRRA
jgi:hypothetical protein